MQKHKKVWPSIFTQSRDELGTCARNMIDHKHDFMSYHSFAIMCVTATPPQTHTLKKTEGVYRSSFVRLIYLNPNFV